MLCSVIPLVSGSPDVDVSTTSINELELVFPTLNLGAWITPSVLTLLVVDMYDLTNTISVIV